MTLAMALPLPRTSASFGAVFDGCILAHAGSASRASGLRAGGLPSKTTVPVMVDCANAAPGHNTAAAASPAATHHSPAALPMLLSVISPPPLPASHRYQTSSTARDSLLRGP